MIYCCLQIIREKKNAKIKILTFYLICFFILPSQAGVGLSQTRIVIDEATNSAAITARNEDSKSYLVASFIAQKLDSKTPSEGYFVITPSIFKLAPKQRNIIKIKALTHKFPKNRESMYYFHSRCTESDKADG
ncbi:fimbrial biogenesis chaperone [Providencia huaxiensis]|uniref:fimbrial biogenesis chaperone n=1 Tax=Providencia huaxiensis TaxID=2027290 RepID=UPI0034DDA557